MGLFSESNKGYAEIHNITMVELMNDTQKNSELQTEEQ